MALPADPLEALLDHLVAFGHGPALGRHEVLKQARERRPVYLHKRFGDNHRARSRYRLHPGEVLASLELSSERGSLIDQHLIAEALATAAGLPYERIDGLKIDQELAASLLPKAFATSHAVLPLRAEPDGVVVAVADPSDKDVEASLERRVRGKLRRVVSGKEDILKYLHEIHGFRASVESAALEAAGDSLLGDFEQLVRLGSAGEVDGNDRHIVNAVDQLLTSAYDQRASDIHIEPRREDSQVRIRIDGVLHSFYRFKRLIHPAIVSRIKTMAKLDIAERRRPQDGRIKTIRHDKSVELRVSTMPVAFGEKVVIRIFDPGVLTLDLLNLGFERRDLDLFQSWIQQPHGLVLVTGPTGSGKSTTLYTALRMLSDERVNVISVEDPIEMITDQFNQVSVQPRIGVDFATALRHILRQDPDVIMVGEIRDGPTAEMAAQAALTGHLVLSTLHTNDTVGALTRLRDQGLPPYLIASTLLGVMAQRLLRRVCEHCKMSVALTSEQMALLGLAVGPDGALLLAARGRGCQYCRNTGYRGRIGVFEMLPIVGEVAQLMRQGETNEGPLHAAGVRAGMQTLRQSALRRLAAGLTSFEEVLRVTGRAEQEAPRVSLELEVTSRTAPGVLSSDLQAELAAGKAAILPPMEIPDPPVDLAEISAQLEESFAEAAREIDEGERIVALPAPPRSARELLERYENGEREFGGAELAGVDLLGMELRGVDLSRAVLSGSHLTDADLAGSRLQYCELGRADLRGANLRSASLLGARLMFAKLGGANLQYADLAHADLRGANLRYADLKGANLRGCQADADTRWPKGYPERIRPRS